MAGKKIRKSEKDENPFLASLSIRKWQPDPDAERSLDDSLLRIRGGKDDEYARG